jgi:nitrate reductase gamma subunit
MTLLEFARGPAFQVALTVFAFGVAWRLAGIFLMMRRHDFSKPRKHSLVTGGMRAIAMRSLPPHELEKQIVFQHVSGYAWHLTFFISILFFAPHIPFFKQFLGFGWPTLPNVIALLSGAVAASILVALIWRRATRPVLRHISSIDDYVSILLTLAPLVTGFVTYARVMPFGLRYETLLGLHVLSVCALLVWFPFGKLMHLFLAFPARFQAGALLRRKGVEA